MSRSPDVVTQVPAARRRAEGRRGRLAVILDGSSGYPSRAPLRIRALKVPRVPIYLHLRRVPRVVSTRQAEALSATRSSIRCLSHAVIGWLIGTVVGA
jgi:hypothetical protein